MVLATKTCTDPTKVELDLYEKLRCVLFRRKGRKREKEHKRSHVLEEFTKFMRHVQTENFSIIFTITIPTGIGNGHLARIGITLQILLITVVTNQFHQTQLERSLTATV